MVEEVKSQMHNSSFDTLALEDPEDYNYYSASMIPLTGLQYEWFLTPEKGERLIRLSHDEPESDEIGELAREAWENWHAYEIKWEATQYAIAFPKLQSIHIGQHDWRIDRNPNSPYGFDCVRTSDFRLQPNTMTRRLNAWLIY